MNLCKERADQVASAGAILVLRLETSESGRRIQAVKLLIEIASAAFLIVCIVVSSAAFAGPAADGVTCSFSVPKGASPAARCAAIKRQCGGKYFANYCGDKLLSAVK